jgi:TetR/AcrR family transcriptional regulator, tetracycline repressor protein
MAIPENNRGTRERLTRERIVEAALDIMDREGLEAVTMRRVARALGVEAMSLYNHVEDKEDILDGICELAMRQFVFPEPSDDWEELARKAARAWRDLFRAHPSLIHLFAERRKPMQSADALRPMEFALEVIRRIGLTDQDAVQAFRAFGAYLQGSIMTEVSPLVGEAADEHRRAHDRLAAELPIEEFPRLAEALPHLAACDPEQVFEYGLDLMIAGLKAKVATPDGSRSAAAEPIFPGVPDNG